ncbi:octopamine receptor beta-2R-like [Antedon mediterranea]|uniref:octopamine receptor beta-2R-like n=1 Tax=Antedon mediterranea TaxID=105859 RepID=UPI003AF9A684
MPSLYDITNNETFNSSTMNSVPPTTGVSGMNFSEVPPMTGVSGMNLSEVTAATGVSGIYSKVYLNFLIISIIILMIISMFGNTMIILATIFYKSMRTKTNIAILNLAIADIGVTVLAMPVSLVSVIKNGEDWMSPTLCDINSFCNALFLIASVHSLMYISVHKYFSLVKPLNRYVTKRRTIVMIIVAWLTGIACGIGPIFGWTTNEFKHEQGATQCGPQYPETPLQKSHGIFVFAVGLFAPLVVLFFTYTAIFVEVHRFSNRLLNNTSMAEMRIVKQKIRITVTLFIIVVAFLICWLPYMTYVTWAIIKGYESIPIWFNSFAYWSGYLSCALNPIIYAWRTKTFRTAFLNILRCKSKMDKTKITAELSPHFPKKYKIVGALVPGYPTIINHQQTDLGIANGADLRGHPEDVNDDHTNDPTDKRMFNSFRLSRSSKKSTKKEDCKRLFRKHDKLCKENIQMEIIDHRELVRTVFSCPAGTFDSPKHASTRWPFSGLDIHRQCSI